MYIYIYICIYKCICVYIERDLALCLGHCVAIACGAYTRRYTEIDIAGSYMNMYMYMYIYICIYKCIYVYGERDLASYLGHRVAMASGAQPVDTLKSTLQVQIWRYIYVYIYIYIYICIYKCICVYRERDLALCFGHCVAIACGAYTRRYTEIDISGSYTYVSADRCHVRLSDATPSFPIIKTTKLLVETRLCTWAKRMHP